MTITIGSQAQCDILLDDVSNLNASQLLIMQQGQTIRTVYPQGWILKLELFGCQSGSHYVSMLTKSGTYLFHPPNANSANSWLDSIDPIQFYYDYVKSSTLWTPAQFQGDLTRCIFQRPHRRCKRMVWNNDLCWQHDENID